MPVILFARWIQMLAISLGTSASKNNDHSIWIVPTISTNESLIRAALTRGRRTDLPQFTLYNLTDVLPLYMDFRALLTSGWQTLLLVLRITLFGTNRTALLLHARDSTNMLLLAKFARSHPNDLFATDCHYQRWSFILSHTARDLTLVQILPIDRGNNYFYSRYWTWPQFLFTHGSFPRLIVSDDRPGDLIHSSLTPKGANTTHSQASPSSSIWWPSIQSSLPRRLRVLS